MSAIEKILNIPEMEKLRDKMWRIQNHRCAYCGREVLQFETETGSPFVCSEDHITPRSRGGKDTDRNILMSCLICNLLKDDKSPETFIAIRFAMLDFVARQHVLEVRTLLLDYFNKLGPPLNNYVKMKTEAYYKYVEREMDVPENIRDIWKAMREVVRASRTSPGFEISVKNLRSLEDEGNHHLKILMDRGTLPLQKIFQGKPHLVWDARQRHYVLHRLLKIVYEEFQGNLREFATQLAALQPAIPGWKKTKDVLAWCRKLDRGEPIMLNPDKLSRLLAISNVRAFKFFEERLKEDDYKALGLQVPRHKQESPPEMFKVEPQKEARSAPISKPIPEPILVPDADTRPLLEPAAHELRTDVIEGEILSMLRESVTGAEVGLLSKSMGAVGLDPSTLIQARLKDLPFKERMMALSRLMVVLAE